MRIIATKVHGFLDYAMGLLLIGIPLLLNLASNEAETLVPVIIGGIIILYSLFTNYELGAGRLISMRNHLRLDLLAGIVLSSSPWMFGFSSFVWQPHFLLGIITICISLVTKTRPPLEWRDKHQRPVVTSVIEP